jgi:hypothetical protein
MDPDVHTRKVKELKDLLNRKRSLEVQVILEKWHARQQQIRHQPWSRIFPERVAKNSLAKSLREAVKYSWDLGLPDLRPCWLVSPGAASQIFPLSQGLFDLVIFDEASQCPVEQAIPAIYRGKNLLISGDEKQLPPTTFFSASADLGEDEPDESEIDADDQPAEAERRREQRAEEDTLLGCTNLLELAIGKLKQLYLCVHYRSDHPALIEFSNRAFYRGQLESPPAQRVSIEGERPIEFHAVDGQYIDRTNPDEAEHIIRILKNIWAQPGQCPTLGVVTFNQAQRDLIEDRLEQVSSQDDWFRERHQQERDRREQQQDVGFFVKNLENVQGDERDVIIFSTTFGKDGRGQFNRRFGPVAAAGGHRRLNVAITRAKRRVIIVSSMLIDQITKPGVESADRRTPAGYLQLYLKYAQAVSDGKEAESRRILDSLKLAWGSTANRPGPEIETPLERDVRAVLADRGFEVVGGIGEGDFCIDLGVLHRDRKRGYILGIECDGGQHTGRSARISQVWRAGVLQRRGWRLYRIWSTGWWMNREAEIRKLESILAEASAP